MGKYFLSLYCLSKERLNIFVYRGNIYFKIRSKQLINKLLFFQLLIVLDMKGNNFNNVTYWL